MFRLKNRLSILIRRSILRSNRKQFESLPDDVYLVSYPRSGNTWMRYMLANLIKPGEDWNINTISQVIPDLHKKWPDAYIEPSPRIIKSHFIYQGAYRRVIYLFRDGRDVAISYFDFLKKVHGYRNPFDIYFQEFLSGKLRYGAWHQHVDSWLSRKNEIELIPIKYCDLVENTENQMLKLGEFLGYKWNSKMIRSAIHKSTLKKQQNDFLKYKYETHARKGYLGGIHGKPGKWKSILTQEQNNQFWDIAGGIASSLGYQKSREQ